MSVETHGVKTCQVIEEATSLESFYLLFSNSPRKARYRLAKGFDNGDGSG